MVDDHRIDVFCESIADRSNENVAFFINVAGCWRRLNAFDNNFPKPQQICDVSRKFFASAFATGGSNDEADALRQLHIEHHSTQLATFILILDLSTNTNSAQRRH